MHHHFRLQEILRFYIFFSSFYLQEILQIKHSIIIWNSQEILWIFTFQKTSISHLLLPQQLLSSFIMTCNVKSVESQTTCLLRSIVNRRVSLLLINASVEAKKAAISWNINIKEQLFHWVSNQLDEVINMLNKLQSQQDLTLQLNEHWLLVQDDHKKRAKQLEVTFDKNDELEKKISQLQDDQLNFRAKQRQADRSMPRQDTQSAEQWVNQKEARSQRESSTLSDNENENDHHKFIKLSNLLIFIEINDSIWKTWNIKIADKLNVNANHYSTEKIHIVYVIFRLEDDADQQIYAKHHVDAFSFYQSLSKLLKHLKEIYEDQNLIWKCHHEYVTLKQLNKLFSSFYSEFTRIFSFLNYDNITLMNDIQNKINNRLQNVLSVCLIEFSSLNKFKIFLQDVNNKQRVNYQLRNEQQTVKSIATSKKRFVSLLISASVSITSYVQLATFFTLKSEWSRMSIICFNCKVSSHLSKNCSQLKTSTSTSHAFISCLNEIIMSKEEKKLFTEKSKNETKN